MERRSKRLLSRRNVMLAGAGVGAAGVAVSSPFWRTDGFERSVIAVVKRVFGDDVASDAVLAQFAAFYARARPMHAAAHPRRRRMIIRSVGAFGGVYGAAAAMGAHWARETRASVEDEIGQAFVRNTNMAYREPGSPIEFAEAPTGPYTCANPIARFDFND